MFAQNDSYFSESYDLERVTVQDCLDNYYMKGLATVISNGKVERFVKENETATEIGIERGSVETVRRFATGFTGRVLAVTG